MVADRDLPAAERFTRRNAHGGDHIQRQPTHVVEDSGQRLQVRPCFRANRDGCGLVRGQQLVLVVRVEILDDKHGMLGRVGDKFLLWGVFGPERCQRPIPRVKFQNFLQRLKFEVIHWLLHNHSNQTGNQAVNAR